MEIIARHYGHPIESDTRAEVALVLAPDGKGSSQGRGSSHAARSAIADIVRKRTLAEPLLHLVDAISFQKSL